MMSVIFLLVAMGFGLSSAAADIRVESSPSVIAMLQTGRRVTRQPQDECTRQEMMEFFSGEDVIRECAAGAASLNISELEQFELNAMEDFGETFCKPVCGTPLLAYVTKCFGDIGQNLQDFFIQLCAKNSKGDFCHSASVIFEIRRMIQACEGDSTTVIRHCGSFCHGTVGVTLSDIDCCINVIDVGGLTNGTALTARCSQVDVPKPCSNSTLTATTTTSPPESTLTPTTTSPAGSVAPSMGILVGALAVFMIIILQDQ